MVLENRIGVSLVNKFVCAFMVSLSERVLICLNPTSSETVAERLFLCVDCFFTKV